MISLSAIIQKRLDGVHFNLKRDKWLVLYTFLAIFQPPFIPFAFIYILGLLTLVWLYYNGRSRIAKSILIQSKLYLMMKVFACILLYVIVVGLLDMMLIEKVSVGSTRFSSINQITVLTFCQFCFIWLILIKCYHRQFELVDIFLLIMFAGILQGLCAVTAFLVPPIRTLFLMFCDREIFSKEFFLLRRGYGFSINLLDTFGYGMGLIASYMLIIKWSKSKVLLIGSILLIVFTTTVNARTGIAVFGMGVLINFLLKRNIIKSIFRLVLIFLIFELVQPLLISGFDNLSKSNNETVVWVALGMKQVVMLVGGDDETPAVGVEDVTFFDNFIDLPSDTFEYLFGTGHHVYDTQKTMGFRTDIGYLNLLWEFGIIGTGLVLLAMGIFLIAPFFMTKNLTIRKISLLNLTAYAAVLMKAILIGFNPGVFINYLATFSLYYIINKERGRIGAPVPSAKTLTKTETDVNSPLVNSNPGV